MLAPLALLAVLSAAPPTGGAHLGVGVGTDFPIDASAHLRAELPGRVQLFSSFGVMPRAYFNVINDSLVRYGAYSDTDGRLIDAALDRALVWRSQLGWRPFPASGFTFGATYTLLGLGGRATAGDVLAATIGFDLPQDLNFDAKVSSRLHQVGAEVGWQFWLHRRASLELALGGGYTVGSTTTIDPQTADFPALLLTPFTSAGERLPERQVPEVLPLGLRVPPRNLLGAVSVARVAGPW